MPNGPSILRPGKAKVLYIECPAPAFRTFAEVSAINPAGSVSGPQSTVEGIGGGTFLLVPSKLRFTRAQIVYISLLSIGISDSIVPLCDSCRPIFLNLAKSKAW